MIIGLTGKKGVGKDTVGEYLASEHDFVRGGFADKLKEAAGALFNVSLDDVDVWKNRVDVEVKVHEADLLVSEMTWRKMLQRFGTEMGRNVFGANFWVNQFWLDHDLRNKLVITDVRFTNEAESIIERFGHIIEVRRGKDDGDTHPSEAGLPASYITATIDNNGSFGELFEAIDELISDLHVRSR